MKVKNEDRVEAFVFLGCAASVPIFGVVAVLQFSYGFATYNILWPFLAWALSWIVFGGLAAYFCQEIYDWLDK